MPYLQLNTSVRLNDAEKHDLCEEIGKLMPLIPGKSRDNTMMCINDGCYIEKKDASRASLNLVVRLLGEAPDECKKSYITEATKLFEDKLGVNPENIFINIVALDDWGVNGAMLKAPK
jgi:phenylpyruvate tautomerase PptA (4-oxalocrotonate tautomerase family)